MLNFKNFLALLVAVTVITPFSGSVKAQTVNNGEPDPFQSNEQDPLEGGSGINPLDLIHNANLLNLRSGSEFLEDTNKNLDSATSDFKKQQQQRLLELQQQGQTANTDSEPSISEQPE